MIGQAFNQMRAARALMLAELTADALERADSTPDDIDYRFVLGLERDDRTAMRGTDR